MVKMTEEYEKTVKDLLDRYQQVQKDYQKVRGQRQQLDGVLNETMGVLKELDYIKPGNTIYKLTGPILIEQSLEESRQHIEKRKVFLQSELKERESMIATLQDEIKKRCEMLEECEQQFLKAQKQASSSKGK